MESEARNQNNDYNKFFYATMCHVCKWFGDGVRLPRCGNCRMIAYCGQEHQKQHWKQHKPLCKAIQDVLLEPDFNDRGKDSEDCDERKLIFMMLVSRKLGRHLKKDETEMFKFPKECLICHEKNDELLEVCQMCAASFCKNHKDDTEHGDICAALELSLSIGLFSIVEENKPSDVDFQHISCTSTFQNMKDFVKTFGNIPTFENIQTMSSTDSEILYNILAANQSEYLTRPLTLFNAVRLLNYVPKSNDLVVHVIGATCVEETTLTGWKVLARLIGTEMSVVLILIGPELTRKLNPSHTCESCDNCMSREKKCLTLESHDVLYEDYVRSSSFVEPDLVVGFNLNIHEHELGSSEETWAPSIRMLAKQNCPFVLTSVTLQDFEKETDRINTILGRQVDYIYKEKNPFASLRPHRVLGPERVYYENQYLAIYRNLCS
ncbi:uncharacterized protein LOC112457768 [Temnothorax curvispinosus]|uniref:Uncharacterized protein LOC112453671 n=1 Tax=Temnothorax curvispinosus TaxID=300111 RepID=A0A6J1PLW6_9HYME|nr:uncharacterized protein LOC112453671 [Temnothorax curvispinosus]XP_024870318.1 uncharacterized protein LOC112453671 [Temnothorax curvispinosus]XP_024870319.1 uncharacterized protein LOC112453671 [Temnothorax curvispinosus]XP_024876762.1 uncharacterized protein LOC112457768 [Temnothorax curvispinosus]XP_024876763.1 uncharacterized protein LOC112457768 [Temnothorax curvispinosus]XP_024876764.1 uncharacterized protein LOC112457768 [Temnothorax curvispinosus]